MNYTISFVCSVLLSLPGIAQQTHVSLSSLSSVTIHLKEAKAPLPASPFSHFEVIDERTDTSRIGLHTFIHLLGGSRTHQRQMVFQHPAAREIAAWLDAHFTRPDAPYTALIVLRDLWLYDANYLREDKLKNPDIADERSHIRLKAEIYAVKDSQYIPLIRFDTLQTYKRSNTYNDIDSYYSLWDRDLTNVLNDMADSAAGMTATRAGNGRRIRLDDILQFNRSRFEAPITGTTTPNAGVYANFDEFRNNAPSIQNFEIRRVDGDLTLYIKDGSGVSYYSHDAWGYCDGKDIYIMREGMLLPVWKEGKAYYFMSEAYQEQANNNNNNQYYDPGRPPITTPNGTVIPGSPGGWYPAATPLIPPLIKSDFRRIFTVDMDSGHVY